MIIIGYKEPSIFKINHDIVLEYKRICDSYLVSIRRNMTRQCVDFRLYAPMNKVFNAYGDIINSFLEDNYSDEHEYNDDYRKLEQAINDYKKDAELQLVGFVYDNVCDELDMLKLAMGKLRYIAENFCIQEEES